LPCVPTLTLARIDARVPGDRACRTGRWPYLATK